MNSSRKERVSYKLTFLIILFIGVCAITWWVSKKDVATKVNSFFSSRTIPVFYDSTRVEEMKKTVCGYWYRNEIKQLPHKIYSLNDCVELKENGVFWQVQQYSLWLPNGDSVNFMHVLTGFINPFKSDPKDSNAILIDAFMRAQAYAFSQETCYVASLVADLHKQQDIMAMTQEVYATRIKRVDSTLMIDQKVYTSYDTIKNPLAAFFPLGSVELVDKFSIEKCPNDFSLSSIVKSELEKYYSSCPLAKRDSNDICLTIQRYYHPLIVAHLANKYTSGVLEPMKGQLLISVSVKTDGTVDAVSVKKGRVTNDHFPQRLTEEIKTWRFARAYPSQPLKEVLYEFNF